ncbi:hypothetical protein Tco_1241938, partial [Tanacetum coccineum]
LLRSVGGILSCVIRMVLRMDVIKFVIGDSLQLLGVYSCSMGK